MALVGYSDSEGSDTGTTPAAPPPSKPAAASRISKPLFQKVVDPSAPRRIKVDLPSAAKEEPSQDERPVKKARIEGGPGGFNSFLPAPKRTAELAKKTGLGSGVSLKTGATPAFSREPVRADVYHQDEAAEEGGQTETAYPPASAAMVEQKPPEIKTIGNPMKFRPLSVANKKRPKKKPISTSADSTTSMHSTVVETLAAPTPPPPKPKISLFSVTQEPDDAFPPKTQEVPTAQDYTPLVTTTAPSQDLHDTTPSIAQPSHLPTTAPNSLSSIAADLNLTPQERRRLFGRHVNASTSSSSSTTTAAAAISVANFNMDSEYAANEAARLGEQAAAEHRAVKAIAPGKHSLQQLVNAASTQKEALEDAWAEGKRNRSEGGGKYGWS